MNDGPSDPQASSENARNTLFVTIGSTSFDTLIEIVSSSPFQVVMLRLRSSACFIVCACLCMFFLSCFCLMQAQACCRLVELCSRAQPVMLHISVGDLLGHLNSPSLSPPPHPLPPSLRAVPCRATSKSSSRMGSRGWWFNMETVQSNRALGKMWQGSTSSVIGSKTISGRT